MNKILIYIMLVFMGLVGGLSTLYLIVSFFVMIIWKLYRMIRYGDKWSD